MNGPAAFFSRLCWSSDTPPDTDTIFSLNVLQGLFTECPRNANAEAVSPQTLFFRLTRLFCLSVRSTRGTEVKIDGHTSSTLACSPSKQYRSQILQVRLKNCAIPVKICLPRGVINQCLAQNSRSALAYHQPWPSRKIPHGKPTSRRQRRSVGQKALSKFQIKKPRAMDPRPTGIIWYIVLSIPRSR